ncbi:serine protease inhibitor 3/4 isoform X6 [Diaphorina citri]|uniref:Serine protease inhibitor 3/4 isoform X6 n=1 Tax=Diaphorina citri TaxID=121845 RepID=A0A1S3DHD2_DIACI|nr:serine protease inhibitor 3/4 isoform X6 [Diaphorina citri]
MFQNLAANKKENAIISPFSLHVVLGLASFGAAGSTAEAMMKGLRIKHSETLLKDYKGIIDQLSKSPELKIANKIYFAKDIELNPAYQTQAVDNFNSELGKVDFSQPPAAAKEMNDWVSNHTNDKIKDLIKADSLDASTKLVLINAIHFKGKWTVPFKPEATKDGPFYLDDTNSVQVPLMFVKDSFYMYEEAGEDGFKMLELPYGSKDEQHFSMHIFLPNKRDGLASLEEKLFQHSESFAEKFGNIVKSTFKTEVEVTLPRFKIESTWEMNDLCKKLGMEVAFSSNADFSLMTKNKEPLLISEVIQKAFIEVNEEGTEAAAATVMKLKKRCYKPPKTFSADHPFWIIISCARQHITFISKVTKFRTLGSAQKTEL